MAWHGLRAAAAAPKEAELFRMQQGQEIGALARQLHPGGILITRTDGKTAAETTLELLADRSTEIFFEATALAVPFIAKADILQRLTGAWHVLEVKSRFSDGKLGELVNDLAYTVMVFKRAGLPVSQASLVLLSRSFRFGGGPDQLFDVVDATVDVMERVAELESAADAIAKALFQDAPPVPALVSACRECTYFEDTCLGAGIVHTVLDIPGLHHKKLKRLSAECAIDLSRIPDDLELNDRQQRAMNAALSGRPIIGTGLAAALAAISWPCHYLDFETVATVMPLYEGHACHQQVLTQFSIHHRNGIGAEPRHSEYLADAGKDCQREVAAALIAALGEQGAIIVYSSFEKTRITALRDAFPDLAAPLDMILGRLVDLLSFISDYVSHPDFKGSFSIKRVLPALVPDLSYKGLAVADGDTAITRFARMARGEITGNDIEPTRRHLLDYCKLDTFAMLRLHETLHEMAILTATAPAMGN
jgi:CRISPR/Cas system-associated exonuclease Cas4 (RecB family)